MTADEGRALIALVDDLQTGRVQITPAGEVVQTPPTQTPAPAPTTPTPPPEPQVDEWGNPIPVATLPPEVQAQLDEMREFRQQLEAQQQAQWQQWVAQEQAAGAQDFFSSSPITLTPEEQIVLERRAAASGEFALAMNQTGNARESWKTALDRTLYSDPTFRDRIIQSQVEARARENANAADRARRAASVAAGGGTVGGSPSGAPVPVGPLTMGDAKEAAAREVAALWAQGQPDS